jgi:hypothetical protein
MRAKNKVKGKIDVVFSMSFAVKSATLDLLKHPEFQSEINFPATFVAIFPSGGDRGQ